MFDEHTWWHWGTSGANVGELVGLFVAFPSNMPKSIAVEVPFECVVERTVCDHVGAMSVALVHCLLDDEVGVTVHDEACGAAHLGHPHAVNECLVFGLVVGCAELHPKDISHLVP